MDQKYLLDNWVLGYTKSKQCYDKAFRHNEHILFQSDKRISDSDNDSMSSQVSNDSSVSTISNHIDQYTSIDLKFKLRKYPDCLISKPNSKVCKPVWINKKINFPDVVEIYIHNYLRDNILMENTLQIYTEIVLYNIRYRANPNYRGSSWYDWAFVRFE